ncbi:MAG: hypothetical protein NT004_05390 [Bacteroidetes bacterium]|nr:hypothetical protein [Bacteroidota bacterium]
MVKKTKSIAVTRFDYIIKNLMDEELDIQGNLNLYSEFDPAGKPLKEIRYTQDGAFEEMIGYEYDELGRLKRESYFPEENELAEEVVYTNSDSGKIIQALKNYQDGSVDTIDYFYNDAGRLIRKVVTNDENEIEQTEIFSYENETLINHETFDGDGNLIAIPSTGSTSSNQSRITTNESGQEISEEELDENGEVIMSIKRNYNNDGQPDEVEVFIDGQGRMISRHYILKYEYTYFD